MPHEDNVEVVLTLLCWIPTNVTCIIVILGTRQMLLFLELNEVDFPKKLGTLKINYSLPKLLESYSNLGFPFHEGVTWSKMYTIYVNKLTYPCVIEKCFLKHCKSSKKYIVLISNYVELSY